MSTENTYIEFYRGEEENLPQNRLADAFYVTTDTGKIWLGERRVGVQLEDGLVTNSIQQEGENIAGGRAFKFNKIDTTNKKFTLVKADGSNPTLEEVAYGVGDEYSFIFFHQYNIENGDPVTYRSNCKGDAIGKITSVQVETDGSLTVAVDTLHHTVKGDTTIPPEDSDWNFFLVATKPSVGDVEIGSYATTLGYKNINVGEASFVCGQENVNSGMFALIGGRLNTGGYGALIGGRNNRGTSNYATVGGSDNIITGDRGTAFGLSNKVESANGFAGNLKNTVKGYAATAFGDSNKIEADASSSFIGGGTNNVINKAFGSVGGGVKNTLDAKYAFAANYSNTVSGESGTAFGNTNTVNASATNGFIGGGNNNIVGKPHAFIAGGTGNTVNSYRGFSAGEGNTNDTGNNNGTMGLQNTVQSHMGFAGGQKTRVTTAQLAGEGSGSGYASFGWGNNLLITGGASIGGGAWNKILADYGVVGGFTNTVNHKYSAVFGQNNNTSAENQMVCGKFSNPSYKALLSIGNGTSDTDRRNVFEVLNDGTATLGDKSVATVDLTQGSTLIGVDNVHVGGGRHSLKQYRVQSSPFPGSVVKYDTVDKRFTIEEPRYDSNPATKKYVDNANPVKDGVLKVGNTTLTEAQLAKIIKFIDSIEEVTE